MKRLGFWITAGLLIIPVVIFLIFNAGKNNYKLLPILGERIAPDGISQKDTVYYQIPDFSLTDQRGIVMTQKSLHDKIYIANFFFASCKDVCPAMNRRLATVYEKFKEFSEVQFISITVDPKNDSVPVLKRYSEKFHADPTIWHFLTGSEDQIFRAGQGFLLPVSKEDRTIDHSQQFILVDKLNRIRGVYDSASDADLRDLEGDIKILLYEYHEPGTKR